MKGDKPGINSRRPRDTGPTDDDDRVEVDVSEDEDGMSLDLPDQAFNLVPALITTDEGAEFLRKLGDRAMSDFERDWESTEDYREKRRQLYKLYRGNLDPKSEPYEDCANIHLPIVLKSISMLVPRISTQIFPNDDYIFSVI